MQYLEIVSSILMFVENSAKLRQPTDNRCICLTLRCSDHNRYFAVVDSALRVATGLGSVHMAVHFRNVVPAMNF